MALLEFYAMRLCINIQISAEEASVIGITPISGMICACGILAIAAFGIIAFSKASVPASGYIPMLFLADFLIAAIWNASVQASTPAQKTASTAPAPG